MAITRQQLKKYDIFAKLPSKNFPKTFFRSQKIQIIYWVDNMDKTKKCLKDIPTFKNCQRLVSRYALSFTRIQDKIFESYGQNDEKRQFFEHGFYDTNKLKTHHQQLCAEFAKCHQQCQMPAIEEMESAWVLLVETLRKPEYQQFANEPETMRACQNLMKFIIGFCLLEAKYYEAIEYTWMLLRFTKFEDTSCWINCLLWALRLEEWDLLAYFLAHEKSTKRKWPVSEGYLLFVECVHLAHQIAAANDGDQQIEAVDGIIAKLQHITANDKNTFLYTHSKAILRSALVMASRMPNACLEKIGDPICQREKELHLLMNIVRAYHPAYFQSNQSSSIQVKMQVADEFMRCCCLIADFNETNMAYCWDCWNAGLLRDAESSCLSSWQTSFAFGIPYRTLRPMILFFQIRACINFESNTLDQYAGCIQALLTPQTASSSYYLQTPKRQIRPSVFRRGSAVDDSFDEDEPAETTMRRNLDEQLAIEMSSISILEDKDKPKQQFHLEAHVSNCGCTFCVSRSNNWAMELELEWLTLLFRRNTSTQFALFQQTLNRLRDGKIQQIRNRLMTELFEHWKKPRLSPQSKQNPDASETVELSRDEGRPTRRRRMRQSGVPMIMKVNSDEWREDERRINLGQICQAKMRFPPIFIHYWTYSLGRIFLERPNEAATNVKALEEAIELCELSPLSMRMNWLLLRHFTRIHNCTFPFHNLHIKAVNEDFQNYGHLFFREWRWRCCHYLARSFLPTYTHALTQQNATDVNWQLAHLHVESMVPSVRQYARSTLFRKQQANTQKNESNNATTKSYDFTFQDVHQLKECIAQLPSDITFVNISLDENGVLWLTRCHALHEPIVLKLYQLEKDEPILAKMQELLEASDQSVVRAFQIDAKEAKQDGENETEAKERQQRRVKTFWDERKRLDAEMEAFTNEIQSKWFSAAAPLLLPLNSSSNTGTKIINQFVDKNVFTRPFAMTLVHLLDRLKEEEWLQLSNFLLKIDQINQQSKPLTTTTWTKLRELTGRNRKERNKEKNYTLLVVPPALSQLPWECLPIFLHSPLVIRIPSLHIFEHLVHQSGEIPKPVDGRNSYYVLNPTGDLAGTQKRITEYVERFEWRGLIGQVPSRDQLRMALAENDMFLYIGHGSGGRYFGRSTLRESDCRAASILMGCSSARIANEGAGFDGRATLYEFLTARCPCVIGCLWMVTDGEIDRFFMALMEYCFGELAKKNPDEDEQDLNFYLLPRTRETRGRRLPKLISVAEQTLKLLAEGIVQARYRCKLPFLTGSAVVYYGLPVAALKPIQNIGTS